VIDELIKDTMVGIFFGGLVADKLYRWPDSQPFIYRADDPAYDIKVYQPVERVLNESFLIMKIPFF